jgi:hypothetical protein
MTLANNSAGGSIGNRPASHPSKVLLDTLRAMAIFSWVNFKSCRSYLNSSAALPFDWWRFRISS